MIEGVFQQAVIAFNDGQFGAAKTLFREVLSMQPKNGQALSGLGAILAQEGKPKKAYKYLQEANLLLPNSLDILLNYAGVCLELKKIKMAKDLYERALKINSNVPEGHNGMGLIYEILRDFDQSFWHFHQAALLQSDNSIFIENAKRTFLILINLAKIDGDTKKILLISKEAQDLIYNDLELQLSVANSLSIMGLIEEGQKFTPDSTSEFTKLNIVEWDGHIVGSSGLLVRSEQGVGDQLLVASIIPELKKKCSHLIVECDRRFISLFSRSFPGVEFVGWREPPVERLFDSNIGKQISLMDACALHRPNLASFPKARPYLHTDNNLTGELFEKYHQTKNSLVIGISWASTGTPAADQKSIPLIEMVKQLDFECVQLLSLQYGDYSEEISRVEKKLGVNIIQDPQVDPLEDFDTFASAVEACDIVISCSNVTVHFAGALGIPTYAVIPADPVWTWFLERSDSPWYSSVELFRRTKKEKSWRPAIDRMRGVVEKSIDKLKLIK
jgi:Tfp pilus assembly protein PilF